MNTVSTENINNDLLNLAPCGLHSLDSEGIFIEINHIELEWLGYTREEIVGKLKFTDLVTEESKAKFKALYPEFKKTGAAKDIQFDMIRKDGSILPVLINSRGTFDDAGNFLRSYTFVTDYTTEKKRQDLLRMSTRVLESMAEGVSVSDENGFIVFTNPAEDDIFGYDPGELIGKHVSIQNAYSPEENLRIVNEVISELKAKGEWSGYFQNIKKDGTLFTTQARITALSISGASYWICVQKDISEDVRKEQEMRQVLNNYQFLQESVPGIFWTALGSGEVDYYNSRWYEYTGLGPELSKDWGWKEVLHPDDLKPCLDLWAESINTGSLYQAECRYRRNDGVYRWFLARAIPVKDDKGQITKWFGISTDIQDQKVAEEAAKKRNIELEIINNTGRTIAAQLEIDKIVQYVTDSCTQICGAQFGAFFYNMVNENGEYYTLYTISGVPREMFSKFPMPGKTKIFAPTFDGTRIRRSDDITKDPDYGKNKYGGMPAGHLPVKSYLAVPVISRSGEVLGGLFFGHEGTGVFTAEHERLVESIAAQSSVAIDNARLFDDLLKANKKNEDLLALAKESDQKKDEFMGIASHELKTPLTSLKAYTQLIVNAIEQKDLSNVPKYVYKAEEGVQKLERLVNDLLNVSKIQSGRLQLNSATFDLIKLVNTCIESISLIAPGYSIRRAGIDIGKITGDRERLEQVMINLLTNAVKYSPENKDIVVNIANDGAYIRVSVTDQGIGIPAEKLDKIFTRFYRVDDKSQRFSGLGIGLYISSEIIKRHGGEIGVKSEDGKGSTFWFSLPVNQ